MNRTTDVWPASARFAWPHDRVWAGPKGIKGRTTRVLDAFKAAL